MNIFVVLGNFVFSQQLVKTGRRDCQKSMEWLTGVVNIKCLFFSYTGTGNKTLS